MFCSGERERRVRPAVEANIKKERRKILSFLYTTCLEQKNINKYVYGVCDPYTRQR